MTQKILDKWIFNEDKEQIAPYTIIDNVKMEANDSSQTLKDNYSEFKTSLNKVDNTSDVEKHVQSANRLQDFNNSKSFIGCSYNEDGAILPADNPYFAVWTDSDKIEAVTKMQMLGSLNLEKVDNVTADEIRNGITKENITNALEYEPVTPKEVDSIKKQIKYPYYNHILNSNFKINSRGKDVYFVEDDVVTWLCDLWFSASKGTFSIVSEGIHTAEATQIVQIIEPLEVDKDYTYRISINNEIYTGFFKGGHAFQDDIEPHRFLYALDKPELGDTIRIRTQSGDIINWVDIQDGRVDYEYKVEDPAYAKSRCLPFIQYINTIVPITYAYPPSEVSAYTYVIDVFLLEKMFMKPTIVEHSCTVYTEGVPIKWTSSTEVGSPAQFFDNLFRMYPRFDSPKVPEAQGIQVSLLLSCEANHVKWEG